MNAGNLLAGMLPTLVDLLTVVGRRGRHVHTQVVRQFQPWMPASRRGSEPSFWRSLSEIWQSPDGQESVVIRQEQRAT